MPTALDPATLRRWVLVLLALGGIGIVCAWHLAERRAAFDTEGRIAHRLLSQRAAQLDATLATLSLLQPPAADLAEQRLPAVVGAVLQVLRREGEGDEPWPAASTGLRDALAAAERQSHTLRRAVLASADLPAGQYWLVQAALPASFALKVDARALVPTADWPYAAAAGPAAAGAGESQRDGDAAASARDPHANGDRRGAPPAHGRTQVLLTGPGAGQRLRLAGADDGDAALAFRFAKPLASDSQPFDLRVVRPLRLADLPWAGIVAWALLLTLAAWAWQLLQRQRSAQRRAQELLRLGQVGRLNALGELAAGVAHELNQPLAAISANAQAAQRLLDDEPADLERARQAMAQAVQQSRRAAEVVARLRRLVERPDTGARLQPCALQPALRGALDLLQPQTQQLAASVDLQADDEALQARADPVALEQILHNLLDNALHALAQVPAGQRRLRLRLRREGGMARLDVSDSGPGIAPEALPRLFEPFFSTREGGLGLGLSLCETLATGMGGGLSAAPADPRGAVFTLKLPLA